FAYGVARIVPSRTTAYTGDRPDRAVCCLIAAASRFQAARPRGDSSTETLQPRLPGWARAGPRSRRVSLDGFANASQPAPSRQFAPQRTIVAPGARRASASRLVAIRTSP